MNHVEMIQKKVDNFKMNFENNVKFVFEIKYLRSQLNNLTNFIHQHVKNNKYLINPKFEF